MKLSNEENGADIGLGNPILSSSVGRRYGQNRGVENIGPKGASGATSREFEPNKNLPAFTDVASNLNALNDGRGNMNNGMECDFNAYLSQSPEWPFDIEGWAAFGDDELDFVGAG